MENLEPKMFGEIADHIKNNILTALPTQLDQLDSGAVESLRGKIHVLHYYCTQRKVDADIVKRLKALLETSQNFWELLDDNVNTLSDLKETYKMRWLDLGSAVLTELEEVMSGEESVRDIVVNSIAIMLGWKADTVWVDMAEEDYKLLSDVHIVKIRDELWQFINESSGNGSKMTLKKATEIGEKMNALLEFIAADDLPVPARIMLLSQIYILLLRLNIGKILVILDAKSEES